MATREDSVTKWKAFFSNAGIKDRAEDYAELFVDKRSQRFHQRDSEDREDRVSAIFMRQQR
ncbi:uncharacterized protein LOC141880856 isoform X2 [Acropora palmata]|uniref:uncharacterized protein LOC141880856 isoform X2 n=1 Tax=Acropora palmata TaxID=6131 RepID=UPI003DA141D1